MTSADVPLERKIYDGSRHMSQDLKDSFKAFNENGLNEYFEKIIDRDKYDDVMRANGMNQAMIYEGQLLIIPCEGDVAENTQMAAAGEDMRN